MLDSSRLQNATPNLRKAERNQVTLSAVNAAGKLRLAEAAGALKKLEQETADPMLRDATRTAQKLLQSN